MATCVTPCCFSQSLISSNWLVVVANTRFSTCGSLPGSPIIVLAVIDFWWTSNPAQRQCITRISIHLRLTAPEDAGIKRVSLAHSRTFRRVVTICCARRRPGHTRLRVFGAIVKADLHPETVAAVSIPQVQSPFHALLCAAGAWLLVSMLLAAVPAPTSEERNKDLVVHAFRLCKRGAHSFPHSFLWSCSCGEAALCRLGRRTEGVR